MGVVTVEKLSARFFALFKIRARALRGRPVGFHRWGRFSIRSALRGRRCDPEFAGVSRVGESPNATTRPIGWVRGSPPQLLQHGEWGDMEGLHVFTP